jgi:glycerol-3-phosphate dehydrogenase (NAD(P)+)
MTLTVIGAGAFGTGLAIALAANGPVTLWGRDADAMAEMRATRQNARRLPGCILEDVITLSSSAADLNTADAALIAVPMQKMRAFLEQHHAALNGKPVIACCKGIELKTGLGPVDVIAQVLPNAQAMILTGPSFAADLAKGLPTALTLACADGTAGAMQQARLSTQSLRIYRTRDTIGAQLGGAVKNVIAIACGAVMGAGLGESARAAIMTRGYAEMQRLARHLGADPATLSGLSGLGDLALTCTSDQSRNYRLGAAMGQGRAFDPSITVEGAATALAVHAMATAQGLELPITSVVAGLLENRLDMDSAMTSLLSRPLKEE